MMVTFVSQCEKKPSTLIKDTLILPWVFICAKGNATEQEFRQQYLQNFTQHKALDFMFDPVKALALRDKQA